MNRLSALPPLIVETRCNEATMRTTNPHLPYTEDEIVREAAAAAEAGGTLFHWHDRDPETGESRHDVDAYARVARRLRESTDLVLKPTMGYMVASDPVSRLSHILDSASDPTTRVDLVPVDFGSVEVDMWEGPEKGFTPGDAVYVNPRKNVAEVLGTLREHEFGVTAAVWHVGQIRTALKFREMGLLPRKVLWELVFTGDEMPAGLDTTPECVDAMVSALPEGEPWMTLCYKGDILEIAGYVLTRGGHLAIGTGDFPHARFGNPDNGELVAKACELGRVLGRRVATPEEAREILL